MLKDTCVITFANTDIHKGFQKEFNQLYGDKFGEHIAYTEADIIGTDFYNSNQQMFQYIKYFGFFLWKPYIIQDALKKTEFSNILYCDSNLRFMDFTSFSKNYISQLEQQDCFFVKHEHFLNRQWTKRDCFLLAIADKENYWNAHQIWSPLMGFGKSRPTQVLLNEYMALCKIPDAITDAPSKWATEYPDFIEHRWEQSVMSILAERFGKTGVPDTTSIKWVTKIYPTELVQFKEKINADPLRKSV